MGNSCKNNRMWEEKHIFNELVIKVLIIKENDWEWNNLIWNNHV